jgi:hypothetical protein
MRNGLYSIHVRLGDGRPEKGSGVVVMRDGTMRGGDSFLFYLGTYSVDGESLKGEVVINQHTPSTGQFPLFGGQEVGIGFSGRHGAGRATFEGTALVGRTSMIFNATLLWLADAG